MKRVTQKLRDHKQYVLIGAAAGAANGFFGAGGGMLLVALLIGWTKMEQKKAFATSVAIILPLSVVSAATYWLRGGILFQEAFPYLVGGFLGGIIAGRIFTKISVIWLRRAFGLLIIYGGIRAVFLL